MTIPFQRHTLGLFLAFLFSLFAISAPRAALPPTLDLRNLSTQDRQRVLIVNGGNGLTETGEFLGGAIAFGDINGDTFDDLIVRSVRSRVYVIFGAANLRGQTLNLEPGDFEVPTPGQFRISIGGQGVAAGDVDADGFDDIILNNGAGIVIVFGAANRPGQYLNLFSAAPSSSTASILIPGADGIANFAGDVNADGFADILLRSFNAATGDMPPREGAILIHGGTDLRGKSLNLAASTSKSMSLTEVRFLQKDKNFTEDFGAAAAFSDLDRDGRNDLLIGAPRAGARGEGYAFFSRTSGVTGIIDLAAPPSGTSLQRLGISVFFYPILCEIYPLLNFLNEPSPTEDFIRKTVQQNVLNRAEIIEALYLSLIAPNSLSSVPRPKDSPALEFAPELSPERGRPTDRSSGESPILFTPGEFIPQSKIAPAFELSPERGRPADRSSGESPILFTPGEFIPQSEIAPAFELSPERGRPTDRSSGESPILFTSGEFIPKSEIPNPKSELDFSSTPHSDRISTPHSALRTPHFSSPSPKITPPNPTPSLNSARLALAYPLASPLSRADSGAIWLVDPTPTKAGDTQLNLGADAPANGTIIFGAVANDQIGTGLDFSDLNGDGKDDMIIGSYAASPAGRAAGAGKVHILYEGSKLLVNTRIDLSPTSDGQDVLVLGAGTNAQDNYGVAIAGGGDMNGDGLADFAIGAPGADNPATPCADCNEGAVAVVFGDQAAVTSATAIVYSNPGNAPKQGLAGRLAPTVRAWIQYTGGAGPNGGASYTAAMVVRSKSRIRGQGLPSSNQLANVAWALVTNRDGITTAALTLQYTDAEIAGLTESQLGLFFAPRSDGPWKFLPAKQDLIRNTFTANVAPNAVFAIGIHKNEAEDWKQFR